MGGWIKIHSKLLDWEWASCPETLALWIHILLNANYEDKRWQGKVIPRGSFITSVDMLSSDTGLTTQQVRTSLKRLISTNEITSQSTNRYTMINVCKYNDYQIRDELVNKQNNKPSNNQATNEQQTDNKQITTTEEYTEVKNIEKENIDKSISKKESLEEDISRSVCAKSSLREYAPRVHLKEKEYRTLVEKYGEADTLWMIQKLSAYKISKNKSYASDYGAINSWVVDRMQEEKQKARPKETNYTNDKYW